MGLYLDDFLFAEVFIQNNSREQAENYYSSWLDVLWFLFPNSKFTLSILAH